MRKLLVTDCRVALVAPFLTALAPPTGVSHTLRGVKLACDCSPIEVLNLLGFQVIPHDLLEVCELFGGPLFFCASSSLCEMPSFADLDLGPPLDDVFDV